MKLINVVSYILFCLIGLVLFTGCSGVSKVHYSPLQESSYSAKPVDQVALYLTQKPTVAYKEIDIMTYRAGTAEDYKDVVRHFREKAALVGADGVIMMGSKSGPGMFVGSVLATPTDYNAMAIIYTEK